MDVTVIDVLDEGRSGELATLYDDYEGWSYRSPEAIRQAARNADLVLGLVDRDGSLIAGLRVLTDGVYYARIYDVIVTSDRRREGFGTRLVEAAVDHPSLADVETITLGCRAGVVDFYEGVGFERLESIPGPDGDKPYCSLILQQDG